MLKLAHPAARGLAAAAFLVALALALASPLRAATADPAQSPAAPAAPLLVAETTAAPTKPKQSRTDRVEAHIKRLHDQLAITTAQETQWSAVAQAMRDNAQTMQAAIAQRHEPGTMTAIDDLKAYQAIADAHSQGLQKLIPAFEALYGTMSDAQKKNADTIFGQRRHGRQKGSK
jgi:protein CpxP